MHNVVRTLSKVALVVDAARDNVAVSQCNLKRGTACQRPDRTLRLKQAVAKGQRFALVNIPRGVSVVQYGHPFGTSRGILEGELIAPHNVANIEVDLDRDIACICPKTQYSAPYESMTFQGFSRADGRTGTRNYYLLVPTSLCASRTATQIETMVQPLFHNDPRPGLRDGILAIPHTEGCGCASNEQIERVLRVLAHFITHPNVAAALVIDMGCEQTDHRALQRFMRQHRVVPTIPVDWLSIQKEGGHHKTCARAMAIIRRRLPSVAAWKRTACPIGQLVLGTECGASDAFSGITANRVIGKAVDRVIAGRGRAILSETPEMVGAEHLLMQRMPRRATVAKFRAIMKWYRGLAMKLDVAMSDNLVPENRAGGLINPCIKSLGAIVKGGSSAIEDVLEYGERISQRGLSIMQGPGNDLESVTGLTASGATLICFSTGKGTITGSALTPVIKVASTTEVYRKMKDDMDLDAGQVLTRNGAQSTDRLAETLLRLIVAVASGAMTKAERNGQRQFQIWTAGKLSL